MKSTKNEPNKVVDLPFSEVYNFFRVKKDKKTDTVTGLYFKKVQYIEALKKMGFVRYILDSKIYYIKVKDNVAQMIEEHQVLDDFEDLIKACPNDDIFEEHGIGADFLLECFVNQMDNLTKPKLLTRLRPEGKLSFQKDTKTKSYFYYQNGFVEVDKEGVHFKPYSELKGVVFKTQILERDYIAKPSTKNKNWVKFLKNISGGNDRFDSLLSIIGYLLHHYYQTKRKAIIFTDARISEEADGRSGKGLLFEAIKQMMNPTEHDKEAVDISGKDFNKNDRFKYEECALNTKLIHIDDAQRGLNIENHFVDIARGIKLQRRNKDSVTIPVKMVFSTNRTIRIPSGSAQDRVVEFELADYYSADYSPLDDFKEWFFRDWDTDTWAVFDNVMLEAVSFYLEHGILAPRSINLIKRKLMEETAPEFLDFIEDRVFGVTADTNQPVYKWGEWLNKKGLYEKFLSEHPDFSKKKFFHQRTFTNWMKLFTKYDERISEENSAEKRSNGNDFICFHNSKVDGKGKK